MEFPHISNDSFSEASAIVRDAQRPDDAGASPVQSPRVVIRGESTPHNHNDAWSGSNIAFIDYLAFTVRAPEEASELFPFKAALVDIFNIPPYDWIKSEKGWQGYSVKVSLGCYGIAAFGGKSQRDTVHIVLNSHGCAQVQDWQLVRDFMETISATLTRVDLAHDDFSGLTVNIQAAIKWKEEGLYNSSGRPPDTHLRDDMGSGKGKTLYVGARENGKFARIYEKGKQKGDPLSPWCRAEVEFKNKDRILPYDMLLKCDQYLSGAYKAFERLADAQSKIKTASKSKAIALSRSTEWARSVCGQLINLLCLLNEDNPEAVIRLLRRPGIPPKLEPYFKNVLRDKGLIP